tara:strand:- start:1505 stop:2359 length:855 start_codon:yes stop_codon:yes gene_type:complete
MQEERLMLNDGMNGYKRDHINEALLYEWFQSMPVKPKLLSFNDAVDYNLVDHIKPYKEHGKMHILDSYGWAWLNGGNSKTPSMKSSHMEWSAWMGGHDNNMFFHANKIQWLVHYIQTTGLYSVPQAYLKKSKWFCHPGQFRVYAIEYTDCNEEFVVWDVEDRLLDFPQMTFNEWYRLYCHHEDKALFAVKLDDNRIEMHVGEERDELYKVIHGTIEAFGGNPPILEGTCDRELYPMFFHGTYEGNGIGIVGHLGKEDLRHMMDFHPSKKLIQKENFTLYNNYHK